MSDAGALEARLKIFLDGLSPQARALLVRGIESAVERGEADPAMQLALAAVRSSAVAEDEVRGPTEGDQLRDAMFGPVAQFAYVGHLSDPQSGRIAQTSLDAIWVWAGRDLIPVEIAAAMEASGEVGLTVAADGLRASFLAAARNAIEGAAGGRSHQRLVGQLGGERVHRDLIETLTAFSQVDPVAPLLAGFPDRIERSLVEGEAVVGSLMDLPAEHADVLLWVGAALLPRLQPPSLLAPIAIRLSGTDEADEMAAGPAAVLVDLLVSEIDRIGEDLRSARAAGGPGLPLAVAAAETFGLVVKEAEACLDLIASARWGRKLARIKTMVSAQLEAETSVAAGLVRRVLTGRGQGERGFDPAVADEAERALRFVAAISRSPEGFALNTLLKTARRDVDQAFEVLLPPLFESLRRSHGSERAQLTFRSDAAIRLAGIFYGEDYAAALRRSRQAALASASGMARR